MPLRLVVSVLVSSCAQGTLDSVDPVVIDATDPADATDATDDALDAPAADRLDVATIDVPAVDVPAVDVPAVDARTVDVPAVDVPAVDVPPVDVPAVDAPSDDVAAADVPAPPEDSGWGPGPTGYRVVRDDPDTRWIDACALPGHTTQLSDVDDASFTAPLPFRFRYWGRPLEAGVPVLVTSNGYLTFQSGAPTPTGGIIPNHLDGVDAVVAVQWRDLRTRGPGVCAAVQGNPGARKWILQWSDARYFTSALGHLNFEVVLTEGADTIDFVYATMTLTEPATVALENWEGTRSSVPFTIPQPIVFSNTRARFVPQ